MVYYECQRCGYNTTLRGNMKHHLNRKYICEPILDNISITHMKEMYNLNEKSKLHQNTLNYTKSIENLNEITPNNTKKYTKKMDIKTCAYCNKEFSRRDSLTRHLKRCKSNCNEEKNKIQLLEKDKEELILTVEKLLVECSNMKAIIKNSNTINNTTNNTNNINSNNTIIINNYGEENTKYITKEFIVNLLKYKPFKAIPEMIKYTHFNKEHPENQNIKLTNKKEPYVKVMKNNKWLYQDRKNTITDLIDKQHVQINDETIDTLVENKCSTHQKNNIKRCNIMYLNENDDYMKRLYNESELVVLNNS